MVDSDNDVIMRDSQFDHLAEQFHGVMQTSIKDLRRHVNPSDLTARQTHHALLPMLTKQSIVPKLSNNTDFKSITTSVTALINQSCKYSS